MKPSDLQYKVGTLPSEEILKSFEGLPAAHESAKKSLHAQSLILKGFSLLDAQLAPLASLAQTMGSFNVGMGSLMHEIPEMKEHLMRAQNRDAELQLLGAKGLAMGLVALDMAMDEDKADGDTRGRLCALLRDSCIQALPDHCHQNWTAYCHQVEIAAASARAGVLPSAEAPRL